LKGGAQVKIAQAKIEKLCQGVLYTPGHLQQHRRLRQNHAYPTPQTRDLEAGTAVRLHTNRATDHLRRLEGGSYQTRWVASHFPCYRWCTSQSSRHGTQGPTEPEPGELLSQK
jgi:hypothetical protein